MRALPLDEVVTRLGGLLRRGQLGQAASRKPQAATLNTIKLRQPHSVTVASAAAQRPAPSPARRLSLPQRAPAAKQPSSPCAAAAYTTPVFVFLVNVPGAGSRAPPCHDGVHDRYPARAYVAKCCTCAVACSMGHLLMCNAVILNTIRQMTRGDVRPPSPIAASASTNTTHSGRYSFSTKTPRS